MIALRMRRCQRVLGVAAAGVVVALSACSSDDADTAVALPETRVLGETGTQPGQFRYPRGMDATDLGGRTVLVVVDKTARIQLIDAASGDSLGSLRTPKSDLGMPTGLTVAPFPGEPGTSAVWVADTHEHRVIVYRLPFDHAGDPTEPDFAFGEYGDRPGQFVYPTDVAVRTDAAGTPDRVYVSEYGGNDRVSVFDLTSGTPVFAGQIGISGVALDAPEHDPDALSRPQSIALRRDGRELVVSDSGRHRIVRFDTATGGVLGFTDGATDAHGEPAAPMRFPYGLTLLDDDHALVAEFGGSCLRVVDLDAGVTDRVIGTPGRHPGELATPWTAAVVGRDLFVLDSGNDRVQIAPASVLGRAFGVGTGVGG